MAKTWIVVGMTVMLMVAPWRHSIIKEMNHD